MKIDDITSTFLAHVSPSQPNEWEIDEVLAPLTLLPQPVCSEILRHIPSIWPISNALCYSFIESASSQWKTIGLTKFPDWVRQILSVYELSGLGATQSFMQDGSKFLDADNSSHATFTEIATTIGPYIRGLSGCDIGLNIDKSVWTDTETIFLPEVISVFADKSDNILFYKLITSYQWALIDLRIFPTIEKVIKKSSLLPDQLTALSLYCLIKGIQYFEIILPGLWRRGTELFAKYFRENTIQLCPELLTILEEITTEKKKCRSPLHTANTHSEAEMAEFHTYCRTLPLDELYNYPFLRLLLGDLKPQQVATVTTNRRKKIQKEFTAKLATFINEKQDNITQEYPEQQKIEDAIMLMLHQDSAKKNSLRVPQAPIQIANTTTKLPEDIQKLAQDISTDLGSIPIGYIQAAVGLSGEGHLQNKNSSPPMTREPLKPKGTFYDEWDCRRQGYRKDWCTVLTEELSEVQSNFISNTIKKHYGLRKRLQRQFEMMRCDRRIIKGQKDGDDIDIDAVIESVANTFAGQATSNRLFSASTRNTRDISTLFLVDMSNSTSGWISTVIKESLVLLSEALEQLGDPYGIYGFSGMRRSGCKIYPIKEISQEYGIDVRNKISAIAPKEYTRMAPAIRHLTSLHSKSTSAKRLIICLSDGKPEDYDGYSGNYAIEDTRKAFLEAQGKGITPFCITIDKQAHHYLSRMCGYNNYIFINSIESLPMQVSQLYRNLTR